MKKIYVKPELLEVNIMSSTQILAGSEVLNVHNGGAEPTVDPGTSCGKGTGVNTLWEE